VGAAGLSSSVKFRAFGIGGVGLLVSGEFGRLGAVLGLLVLGSLGGAFWRSGFSALLGLGELGSDGTELSA
jgi:hypothetical protein